MISVIGSPTTYILIYFTYFMAKKTATFGQSFVVHVAQQKAKCNYGSIFIICSSTTKPCDELVAAHLMLEGEGDQRADVER